MILGLSGLAGSGKSTVASVLVQNHGFIEISLADPIKRVVADWYNWDEDRLWGSSSRRNEPDPAWDGLTARHACQILGTEIGRSIHVATWSRKALADARSVLTGQYGYSRTRGLYQLAAGETSFSGVVISDVRFRSEVDAIRSVGGKVARIRRLGVGLEGAAGAHLSEQEQQGIGDNELDGVLDNNGSLKHLPFFVAHLLNTLM